LHALHVYYHFLWYIARSAEILFLYYAGDGSAGLRGTSSEKQLGEALQRKLSTTADNA